VPEPASPPRPIRSATVLAGAACLAYLASELYLFSGRLGFPLDDSWIHLHFARQLADGAGLAYRGAGPEAWVPGSTAPLWTALLALGFALPGSPVLWAKLLGVALFVVTVDATARLAAELGLDRPLQRLAALLVAASHWLVWSALSGMEVALFSALSLWGMVLHLRERAAPERPPKSLPVLALAALARPEGYLLLLLAFLDRCLRFRDADGGLGVGVEAPGRRVWLGGVLPSALVLLPTLLFYRLTGGSFFPTTFAVKASAPADLLPSGRYLRAVLDVLFRSQPLMLLAAGAGVARLVEGLGRHRRGLLPALWLLGLPLAYSLLAPEAGPVVVGNFGRYYFPLLPVVAVLGVLGLEGAARRLGPRTRLGRWPAPLGAILAALLLLPQLWGLATGPLRYLQTVRNVEDGDVRAARWLADRLPPEALLAVQDVGAVGYHLPNPLLDLTGIVEPAILPHLQGSGPADPVYWEKRLLRYLEERRPDYLVVFPRSYPMLTTATPGFVELRRFEIPDNVTLAGDELAVFATPWNQYPLAEGG